MVVILSAHAREAIAVRKLRREWVEHTVLEPDRANPDPQAPGLTRSYRAIAEAGGRVLRVVHRPKGSDILVVTAFFDRGAR